MMPGRVSNPEHTLANVDLIKLCSGSQGHAWSQAGGQSFWILVRDSHCDTVSPSIFLNEPVELGLDEMVS